MVENKSKQVITVRTDGFGARLTAMIHGMYVAEELGLPFKFCWPPMKGDSQFHSVSSAENIFSKEFLDQHYQEHFNLSRYREIVHRPLTNEIVTEVMSDKRVDGINMMVCEDTLEFRGRTVPRDVFPRIWSKIKFSDGLKTVVARAEASISGPAVAIHARRGDTVSGVYRMRLFNERYLPISWLKTITREEVSRGSQVILFSDDARVLSMMRERYDIKTTTDLGVDDFTSNDERALFDFIVMSRCQRIVAAASTYAVLASLIGKVQFDKPRLAFDNAIRRMTVLDDLNNNPDDYTQLDKAKELQWVANEIAAGMSPTQHDDLLRQAHEIDPENQTYSHLRALNFTRRGQYDEAETLLRQSATTYFESHGGRSPEFMHPFNLMGDRISKSFSEPAIVGKNPFISMFYAHNLSKREGKDASVIIAQRAYLLDTSSNVLLAYYAQALLSCARHDDALEPLETALEQGRRVPIFHRQLIDVYEKVRDRKKAFHHAKSGYDLAPDDEFFRSKYAHLLAIAKNNAEAQRVVEGMTAALTQDAAALYQLSKASHLFGNKQLAKECAQKAVILRPRKAHYHKWLSSL